MLYNVVMILVVALSVLQAIVLAAVAISVNSGALCK